MAKEKYAPNVVMDDNYQMFVKALARRYAERGASVYQSAEAIEQDRKNLRTRTMAPDAYRLSKEGQMAANLYKNGTDGDNKYMTTDDYLAYFGKCHDTFEAVTYYDRHVEKREKQEEAKVIVNTKRLEQIRNAKAKRAKRPVRVSEPRAMERPRDEERTRAINRPDRESFMDKVSVFLTQMGAKRRRAMAGLSAMAFAMMLFAGGLFIFSPEDDAQIASQARYINEELPEEEVAMLDAQFSTVEE